MKKVHLYKTLKGMAEVVTVWSKGERKDLPLLRGDMVWWKCAGRLVRWSEKGPVIYELFHMEFA